MPKGEGHEESVAGGESAEQQNRLNRQEIEQKLAGLEAELVKLVEELKMLRKLLRDEAG